MAATETLTLTDFLLARIAEDEERAAMAVGRGIMWAGLADGVASHDVEAGWHVLRWNPSRVLAECEAKRRIVLYSRVYAERDDPTLPGYNLARHVLWDLAFPYADHPDYREEWKP